MTVIIALMSLVIGAFLAHYFATTRMRNDDLSKLRLKAYTDFVSATSRLAVSRRLGNTISEIDDLAGLNDAKNRICICGEREVVEALIEFWQLGATLEGESELLAFKRFSQLVRESLGYKKNDVWDLEISGTLFKLEPSSFSFRASRADPCTTPSTP